MRKHQKILKKRKAKVIFDEEKILKDRDDLLKIHSFRTDRDFHRVQDTLNLLERTCIILSKKKVEELQRQIKRDLPELAEDEYDALFSRLSKKQDFQNILTISKTPKEKNAIIKFSQQTRNYIEDTEKNPPAKFFFTVIERTCYKLDFFLKIYHQYLKNVDQAPSNQELKKFTELIERMNQTHTEDMLLKEISENNSEFIRKLGHFICASNFDNNAILQFSILSRYDDYCSRCEFTVNEIMNLLNELGKKQKTPINTFISMNAYDRKRDSENIFDLPIYNDTSLAFLDFKKRKKQTYRNHQAIMRLFGNTKYQTYALKSERCQPQNLCVIIIEGIINKKSDDIAIKNDLFFSALNEFRKEYTLIDNSMAHIRKFGQQKRSVELSKEWHNLINIYEIMAKSFSEAPIKLPPQYEPNYALELFSHYSKLNEKVDERLKILKKKTFNRFANKMITKLIEEKINNNIENIVFTKN